MSLIQRPVEVFYSYASADKYWLKQLDIHLSLLKHEGFISAWHNRLIIPGTDWSQEIDIHLNRASVILLLISPDFLASDYCYGIEMQRALEREQAKDARVIPILLRPVDWHSAPFARLQTLPTGGKFVTQWGNRDTALANVAVGIRRAIEDLPESAICLPHCDSPTIWDVPFARNPFFLGRDDLLARLRQQLQAAALSLPQAINGLGGIGKTQLAIEYAYQFRQEYQTVLWARAENAETLTSSYTNIATLLSLPEKDSQDQSIIILAVKRWLQTHLNWLLIFDNADEPDVLFPFLPSVFGGHLLLTTRTMALRRLGIVNPITVETFAPEQGAIFLLRRAGLLAPHAELNQTSLHNQTLALQITHELGGLPLAINQAGAYLEATGTSLATYMHLYKHYQKELLSEQRVGTQDHPKSVATTWSLSFQRVVEKNPAAADLLRLCSFLAPDAIGEEILTGKKEELGPVLARVAENEYLFEQAIEALRAYSFITRDAGAKTLTIHRLVQTVLRTFLPPDEQLLWTQRAITVISAAFPKAEVNIWEQCERCLPHALFCMQWMEQIHVISTEAAHLFNRAGYYLYQRGQYAEAERFYKRTIDIQEVMLQPEDLDLASSLNNLAMLFSAKAKYTEAEPLLKRTLAIHESILGLEHPDTASILNNLALLYDKQGKYSEEEALYKQALAIWENTLGPEHLHTARGLSNLAGFYREQGHYAEAESLQKRALDIRERILGPEHPDTVISLNSLARLRDDQGRHTEAEELYRKALDIRERILGPEHPDTVISLNNLAGLYRKLGKYQEAEPLYQQVINIREYLFGSEHPSTAASIDNLATLYASQGRYSEAELLHRRVLGIRESILGLEHPDTALSLNNLATFYLEQGQDAEAETLQKRALSIWEQTLEAEHPYRALALHNLATICFKKKKYIEAEALYKEALALREHRLGPEHLDTAQSLHCLASIYWEQGKYIEAEALLTRVLNIQKQIAGLEHPDTALILNNIALFYNKQGRYLEAEPLYKEALAICERVLGPEHPYTANSLNNLAYLYTCQKQFTDAEPFLRRALEIREHVLGSNHPDTQVTQANYTILLQRCKL